MYRSVGRKQSRGDGDAHENHDGQAKRPRVMKVLRHENDPKGFGQRQRKYCPRRDAPAEKRNAMPQHEPKDTRLGRTQLREPDFLPRG